MRLADEFLELARAHPRRQRPRVVFAARPRRRAAPVVPAEGPARAVPAAPRRSLPRGGLAGRFGLEQGVHL